MPNKPFNPLADIASILGSIAQRLPDLPKLPELPTSAERPSPPQTYHASEPNPVGPRVDVLDPLMIEQMETEQKRQAKQGLVPFIYE
ncbi:unnamed protein product [marine sediment metagenome]|uniref:Uncharacterized protein n=1 Tax=marine sediment metagenome TaxID=412755 RepID=X1PGJ0_9ZZZZ